MSDVKKPNVKLNLFDSKELQVWIDKGFDFVDSHLREIRASKFTSAAQVPKEFVRKNVNLCGVVENINDAGHLQVRHMPILKMPWHKRKEGLIDVKLIGVESSISTAYCMKLLGLEKQKIWFRPLSCSKEYLNCIVYPDKLLKWNNCVNIDVILKGSSRVEPWDTSLNGNKYYKDLYKRLLEAQKKAQKKNEGIWFDPTKKSLLTTMINFIKRS